MVPINDPVWVQHWHNIDDEVFAELLRVLFVRDHKIYKALQSPRALRFTGVHARAYEQTFLIVVLQLRVNVDLLQIRMSLDTFK